jgi:hypothetical protein
MASIFEKNLEALANNNPELVEELRGAVVEDVPLERAKNGEFTLKYKGLYFHSRYDPGKEAELQLADIMERKADWVLLFGMGCGHLFTSLVRSRKEMEEGARVVVYEPSINILVGVLRSIDLSRFFKKDNVYLFTDVTSIEALMSRKIEGIEDILGYQTMPYKQVFSSELVDFLARIENARTISKVYIKTDIVSRLLWLENYFANIKNFLKYPDINSLVNKFKGIPLIVVGAGPSLEKNVHLLKGLKGKAIIVAAVSAFMPLIGHGVMPDFIVCGEKQDLPGHFTGNGEERDTRFILADICHPAMFDRETKGKYLFISAFMCMSIRHAKLWGTTYVPEVGGSVTTTALGLGVDFGCDPVIMIGQDLSFGKTGTHAGGAAYSDQSLDFLDNGKVRLHERYANSEERVASEYKVLWLKGVNEERVASKFDWVTFHSWFEEYMDRHHAKGHATTIINATEGGAYIEGMEHKTLQEVIDTSITKTHPIEKIIEEAGKGRDGVDLEGLIVAYGEILASLCKISKMAVFIVKDAERLQKKFDRSGLTPEMASLVVNIQRNEKKLFDESSNVIFMWETVVEYTYELKEYLREDVEKGSLDQIRNDLESIVTTYTKIGEAADRFIPIMERSVKFVRERKDKTNTTSGG